MCFSCSSLRMRKARGERNIMRNKADFLISYGAGGDAKIRRILSFRSHTLTAHSGTD